MKRVYISFFISCLILFEGITPLDALNLKHDWFAVPKSEYGTQVWDKLSYKKNNDGSIRVLSKFIPITKSDITNDILYTMDINCSAKTFRDVALGKDNFNEFNNPNTDWKEPNGDKLILGVIDQVCRFKK